MRRGICSKVSSCLLSYECSNCSRLCGFTGPSAAAGNKSLRFRRGRESFLLFERALFLLFFPLLPELFELLRTQAATLRRWNRLGADNLSQRGENLILLCRIGHQALVFATGAWREPHLTAVEYLKRSSLQRLEQIRLRACGMQDRSEILGWLVIRHRLRSAIKIGGRMGLRPGKVLIDQSTRVRQRLAHFPSAERDGRGPLRKHSPHRADILPALGNDQDPDLGLNELARSRVIKDSGEIGGGCAEDHRDFAVGKIRQ